MLGRALHLCSRSNRCLSPLPSSFFAARSFSTLTLSTLNPRVVEAQYAVRGEIVIRAEQIKQQLTQPGHGYPFKKIVHCNIGNPQELGQMPITFFRQVMAACQYPSLLSMPAFTQAVPSDVIQRANNYLASISGGVGAYSNSQGVKIVRDEVAEFIEKRDAFKADAEKIFLTDGASSGVKNFLTCIIRNSNDGVLIPIPQYPLYTATLTLCGGRAAPYYLDESAQWGLTAHELKQSFQTATQQGTNVRALVIINPGNPTGQCLSRAEMEQIVSFCVEHRLILMADEVYQTNIYGDRPFLSFNKIVKQMNAPIELISFHSVSKGFIGECGQRGGYFELLNFDKEVAGQLYKMASVSLCSNLNGQLMTGLMVNPPAPSSPSYSHYVHERDTQLSSLKRRAARVSSSLNSLSGVSCNRVDGAMYAFPSVQLPSKFVEEAKRQGKQADHLYCVALLEQTGLVVVPGSGFGQRDGTWHFRTTILPPEQDLDAVMGNLATFHNRFIAKYS